MLKLINQLEMELINKKIVVWKDGTSSIISDGITHEFENDKDWLTTINI